MNDNTLPQRKLKTDRQTEQKSGHSLENSPCEPVRDERWNDANLRAQLRAEHICWHEPCLFCAFLDDDPIPICEPLAYDDLTLENRKHLRVIIENLRRGLEQRRQASSPSRAIAGREVRFAAKQTQLLATQARLMASSNSWVRRSQRLLAAMRATPAKVGLRPRLSLVKSGADDAS